jgi:hypothetical protein
VVFFSRKLRQHELNFEIYDKELLAIKDSLLEWWHWLIDTEIPVEVQTDHKNLTYSKPTQKLNRRHARWSLCFADFNFKLVYTKGKDMGIADPLTRAPNLHDPSEVLFDSSNAFGSVSFLPSRRFPSRSKPTTEISHTLELPKS